MAQSSLFLSGYLPLLLIHLSSTLLVFSQIEQHRAAAQDLFHNQFAYYDDANGDNYLLLSDREITQDVGILKQLISVSKEEIEEIVDSNPVLQQALLDKVKKIVRVQQSIKAKQGEIEMAQVPVGSINSGVQVVSKFDKVSDGIDKFKVELISKGLKLYKISKTLKAKIDKLLRKKKKLLRKLKRKNPQKIDVITVIEKPVLTPRPKFYFRVTTDSS